MVITFRKEHRRRMIEIRKVLPKKFSNVDQNLQIDETPPVIAALFSNDSAWNDVATQQTSYENQSRGLKTASGESTQTELDILAPSSHADHVDIALVPIHSANPNR